VANRPGHRRCQQFREFIGRKVPPVVAPVEFHVQAVEEIDRVVRRTPVADHPPAELFECREVKV